MKLKYSDNRKYGKLNTAIEVICAILMGMACVYRLISMLGIDWKPSDMFSGSFSGGLAGIWNAAAGKLGNIDYVILPRYKVEQNAAGEVSCGLALTIICAAVSVISYLVIKAKSKLLALMPATVSLVLMFFLKLDPSALSGAALAAATVIMLAVIGVRGKIKPEYFIVPLAAVLVSAGIVLVINKTVTFDRSKAMSDAGTRVWTSIDKARYGEDPLPQGDVGSIDGKELKAARGDIESVKEALRTPSAMATDESADEAGNDVMDDSDDDTESQTGDPGDGGKTALTVTMSEPDSYYFRGFIGAQYSGNKWNTLSNAAFYSMRDTTYWMNRRGFDGLSEMSYASTLGGTVQKENKIKIEVKEASKNFAFTPYELVLTAEVGEDVRKSEMKLPEGTKNYGGSHLGTEGFGGKSSYSYTASENLTGQWTDAVGRFYTAAKTDDINTFFINESHYNVMQYDRYLDVPDSLMSIFESEVGPTGDISVDHTDYKDAIEVISAYLREKYIYSETFTVPEKDKDFIESFIEAKRGCDIHFASLAAMLFRYYGIPARYVEGYLVTPLNVTGIYGEAEVNVTNHANHAWTEIYIDGFGWIPFEATPEYTGIMKEADLTKGLQNVDYESQQPDDQTVEEEEPEEETEKENDELGKLLLMILKIILITAAAVLALFILLKILTAIITYVKWKKAFADKDPKAGIKAFYQYSNEKKWKLSEAGEELGLAASYSTAAMEEHDREVMRKEFEKAKERAKNEKARQKAQQKEQKNNNHNIQEGQKNEKK